MHAKKRNGRLSLYRSQYVRKGAMGNSHGYAEQRFVGSVSADALEIPAELLAKLSKEEADYLNQKVLLPARLRAEGLRQVAEEQRRAADARERDPRWRLEEALRLLTEAGRQASDGGGRIDAAKVSALHKVLESLSAAANVKRDPLDAVLEAVAHATAAVKGGYYENAPVGNVRDTPVYKRWRCIGEAVDSGGNSLLKALQEKGYARVRG